METLAGLEQKGLKIAIRTNDMVTAKIILSSSEDAALQAMAKSTGKTQDALLHEAVQTYLWQPPPEDRLALLGVARGIWQGRTDLPDLRDLRAEMDRF